MCPIARYAASAAVFLLFLFAAGLPAQDSPKAPANSDASRADEAAIRANVKLFVGAYNARDAKSIAALFAHEAQMVDQDGNTTQGREAIEKVFAGLFNDAPEARIEVTVDSIRFIGTSLAVESGSTKLTRHPGDAPERDRYTVVHVKTRSGKWLMALARDTEGTEPSNYERLKPLEWMIGSWVDESPESIVVTSCRWAENKNFILQDIRIRMRGKDAVKLSQRIGWDPLTKRVKAWIFDSEGGYGESVWVPDGTNWIVKATGVRRDGTTSSATNTFTRTGKDSYTWRSTDRVVGNEVMPPLEIKVVRKPPEPVTSN